MFRPSQGAEGGVQLAGGEDLFCAVGQFSAESEAALRRISRVSFAPHDSTPDTQQKETDDW